MTPARIAPIRSGDFARNPNRRLSDLAQAFIDGSENPSGPPANPAGWIALIAGLAGRERAAP